MLYRISHRTTYKYVYPVSFGDHVACLRPRSFAGSHVLENELLISPKPAILTERTDYFGNTQCFFTVQEPHKELVVESRSEVTVDPGIVLLASLPWEESAEPLTHDLRPEALEAFQFQFESPRIRKKPVFAAYARESFTPGRPLREALGELTARIYREFRFDSRATDVRTPIEDVFEKRRGVCQDFAHVQIACLRSLGLAARYVGTGLWRRKPVAGLDPRRWRPHAEGRGGYGAGGGVRARSNREAAYTSAGSAARSCMARY